MIIKFVGGNGLCASILDRVGYKYNLFDFRHRNPLQEARQRRRSTSCAMPRKPIVRCRILVDLFMEANYYNIYKIGTRAPPSGRPMD